jgi:hypothetical protein
MRLRLLRVRLPAISAAKMVRETGGLRNGAIGPRTGVMSR